MRSKLAVLAAVACLLVAGEAWAQKSGGILKVHHWDSPASMSIIEEATYSTVVPMMGVFNNLVIYKQDEPQNSLNNIVPDLAHRVVVERGRQRAHLQTSPRGQMARR